jgi:hypothetical protein
MGSSDGKTLLLVDITAKYIRDFAPQYVDYGSTELRDELILAKLDEFLAHGSKWEVVHDRGSDAGIRERMPQEIINLAKDIDNDHLTKAWNMAFGLKANPEGVDEAQKALEYLASTHGLTNATTSVYGSLLGDIKTNTTSYKSAAEAAYEMHGKLNKKENKISLTFADWFATGMDLVQKTNPARHGSKVVGEFKLSSEAAQQAVIIATMLCSLAAKGYFLRPAKAKK